LPWDELVGRNSFKRIFKDKTEKSKKIDRMKRCAFCPWISKACPDKCIKEEIEREKIPAYRSFGPDSGK
jgi:hypothetical protein